MFVRIQRIEDINSIHVTETFVYISVKHFPCYVSMFHSLVFGGKNIRMAMFGSRTPIQQHFVAAVVFAPSHRKSRYQDTHKTHK